MNGFDYEKEFLNERLEILRIMQLEKIMDEDPYMVNELKEPLNNLKEKAIRSIGLKMCILIKEQLKKSEP